LTVSSEEFQSFFPAESDYVERKSGTSGNPLQEAVVAFSNADGGVILIGVQDNGTVVGRELTPGVSDAIHTVMRDVHDPGRYAIHPLQVGGVGITVLAVARRVEGFSQTSAGRVIVRRGTLKVALMGAELRQFVNERWLHRFEEADSGIAVADVGPGLLDALSSAFGGWSDSEERLREHGFTARDRPDHLSIAGALYLVDDPARNLGKAYVEVFRYPSDDGEYDRREELRGPLPRLLEETVRMVGDELGNELVILGIHRHEIPRLPVVVLREAIANALAHRSYELNRTSVRIELRARGVRIISPGGLPEPVTVENLRETQAARNPSTITALRRFGLAEDAGRGIDVIVDSMKEELLDPPTFEDTGESVIVTLPIRSAVAPAERAWIREVEERGLIEPSDRFLLIEAARGHALTNADVRRLLGVDAVSARQSLQRLRDAAFLEQRGDRGGTQYVLAGSLNPPAGLRMSPKELNDLIVGLADRSGRLTNTAVREATGLDREAARRLLNGLVGAGRLELRGERRGAYYVRPGHE
jgi:ATP-dependent DNA helicase RecG